MTPGPRSQVLGSRVPGPRSRVLGPRSRVLGPGSLGPLFRPSLQRHHCMNLHMKRGRYRYQKQPIFHIKISKMPRKAFMRISNIYFLLNGTKSGLLIFCHKLTNNNGKSFSALRGRGHTPFPLAVISPPPPSENPGSTPGGGGGGGGGGLQDGGYKMGGGVGRG